MLVIPAIISAGLLVFQLFKSIQVKKKCNSREAAQLSEVQTRKTQKQPPIHPFLLSLFPVLSLISDNIELLSFDKKISMVALSTLGISSLFYSLVRFLTKNQQKAGALVSISLFLFSTYGHVFDLLSSQTRFTSMRHKHLAPFWGFLEAIAALVTLNASRHLEATTSFLNAFSISLVGLSLTQIILHKSRITRAPKNQHSGIPTPQQKVVDAQRRDIFYLIVDSHASTSTLNEFYGYDNIKFVNQLRERGFFVAERSKSNYSMTMLSLASSLNSDYLDNLEDLKNIPGNGIDKIKLLIEDNFALNFLRTQGYKTIFMGSGFSITRRNRLSDIEIDCGRIDESIGRFLQSTFLRVISDRKHLIENDKRNRILCMFSQLAETPKIEDPKFIFAHIASPQWPFLFDANGDVVQSNDIPLDQEKEAYVQQLIFIDKKINELVQRLLSLSELEPIIIIQADHGPNFAYPGWYEASDPPQDVVLEKMRILNTYYLPNCKPNTIYESISPVNTFRLIFNEYFNTDFPLLEDRHYYSTTGDQFEFYPTQINNDD